MHDVVEQLAGLEDEALDPGTTDEEDLMSVRPDGADRARQRMKKINGDVGYRRCAICGGWAMQWSLDREADPAHLVLDVSSQRRGQVFSNESFDYSPRCGNCRPVGPHPSKQDLLLAGQTTEPLGAAEVLEWVAWIDDEITRAGRTARE